MTFDLQDHFYGCLCGTFIGSAMGAAVENMTYTEIETEYGTLDRLLPYSHYGTEWQRLPGTTEDGIERQKLMIESILKKSDRVTAEDVKQTWIEKINPQTVHYVSEPFEKKLLGMALAGLPGSEIGRFCDYSNLNSFARACHPLGLINAGDPLHAMEDVLQVGQLYLTAGNRGLKWACVTAVAVAAGCQPGATVDSTLTAIFDYCDPLVVLPELERHLEATKDMNDFRQLREYFDDHYGGYGIPYAASYANEVVTKGVCIFRMVKGDVHKAIIAAVNLGRDTDCIAAVAAGITGALGGAGSVPQEWIETVDQATMANPYTNTRKTIAEFADQLHAALMSRLEVLESLISMYPASNKG